MLETVITGYESLLHSVARLTVYTLELIGIAIVIFGSARALVQAFRMAKNKQSNNLVISLGRALALALEFKMGAEIINTVIVRELRELAVLAVCLRGRRSAGGLEWSISSFRIFPLTKPALRCREPKKTAP